MYEILTGLFGIILGFSVYGMFKYGFNVVFIYIGLFSLVAVIWGIVAIKAEKKKE
jgi:hypothetical protein